MPDELARLDARVGPHVDRGLAGQPKLVGSDATRAVAGDFRVGTVGIDQHGVDVGILRRIEPFDTVGADAVVAIAETAGEFAASVAGMSTVDDEEIVAAGTGLGEWDSDGHGLFRVLDSNLKVLEACCGL